MGATLLLRLLYWNWYYARYTVTRLLRSQHLVSMYFYRHEFTDCASLLNPYYHLAISPWKTTLKCN